VTRPCGLVLVAVAALASTIAAAPPPQAKASVLQKSVGDMTAEDEELFTTAAETTMERVCVACHPLEKIVATRRTVSQWAEQVALMRGRGAPGTDADFDLVKKYLPRYYGVVNVNAATAEELTSVLGLSAKDAAAIVEYRKAHGEFTDLASLEKVEGVDKAKLEEQPEALKFR
jgi:competence ComEA-like helix-hairpin-helix protein